MDVATLRWASRCSTVAFEFDVAALVIGGLAVWVMAHGGV